MNKNQNRLIATARQYALVTFLGLGMSFAVAKTANNTQKVQSMDEQEWLLKDENSPLNPESYELNSEDPLPLQCPGEETVCGIIAPSDGAGVHPIIEEDSPLYLRIQAGQAAADVFMKD